MIRRIVTVTAGLAAAAPAAAQTGLLVVAHGAGVEWNARVRETVALVQWPRGPVALAFLMGDEAATAGWDQAVDSLLAGPVTSIVVVPLMVSSSGGHFREIEYYAGARDSLNGGHHDVRHRPPPVPTRVTRALDGAAELGVVLRDRWQALDAADRSRPVVLVAHGPSEEREVASWMADLTTAARGLREIGLHRELRVALLRDDAPPPVRAAAVALLRDTVRALAGSRDSVLVLPILVSSSSITSVKIPRDLEGLPVRYVPTPLAPHPALARWIERSAERYVPGSAP